MKIKFLLLFFVLSLQVLKAQHFTLADLKNFNEWSIDKLDTYLVERGFSAKRDNNIECVTYVNNSLCVSKCNNTFSNTLHYYTINREEYLNIKKEITNSDFLFKKVEDIKGKKYLVYENITSSINLCSNIDKEFGEYFTIILVKK